MIDGRPLTEECPQCGSDEVAMIVYGRPTPELEMRAERGEIALDGCEIPEDPPDREGLACHATWRQRHGSREREHP